MAPARIASAARAAAPLVPGLVALALVLPRPLAADTYPRQPGIDVEHYRFELTLSDAGGGIAGQTAVEVRFLRDDVRAVELDLVAASGRTDGKGMTVTSVTGDAPGVAFVHAGDRLRIAFERAPEAGTRRTFTVRYGGVPATGLRVAPTRHGDRSFFSDNWPNKARHWLPTVDHPYDKATGEMVVTAPAHYQVVSNGLLVEETDVGGGMRRSHWRQSVPIATWLYTLGVARFAVQHLGTFDGRPIQTWVYPQDRDAGFFDFAVPTRQVLEFYDDRIGPFAYEKLANVQSNSVRGGMESATAIFYGDDSVTGTRSERWREVVIHEIAHQWWGNAVTENDWDHVWLSEGFATYFTLLFVEHADGRDAFVAGLRESRDRVRAFHAKRPDYRVVHDNLSDMDQVTTSQTYQKGAWVLHMLRGMVGDEAFWRGVRDYYRRYRDANASTDDFRRAMEEASGQELGWFFRQWLYRGGLPVVEGTWRYDAAARTLVLDLRQVQDGGDPFVLPMEVALAAPNGSVRMEPIRLSERSGRVLIPLDEAPTSVTLDPGEWVLMEASLRRAEP